MKILYMPIFEGGSVHATAIACKRGLYTALAKAGHQVTEFDYLAHADTIESDMLDLLRLHEPDMLLTQLHGANVLLPDFLGALKGSYPDMFLVNWSGDSWLHSLTAQPMIDLLRHVDLQLVAAPDVLPEYERLGIRAGYWNIAYEPPIGELPDMPAYDIVFLGNVINDKRRAMLEMLRTLPYKVGIYGDWEHADGRNVYNFAEGEALYKNARLAIADNVYVDQQRYISNRPMQCMAAGGALLLHQYVERMEELSGWREWVHYVQWDDLADLKAVIDHWMTEDIIPGESPVLMKGYKNSAAIVSDAQAHVLEHHTFDARVRQLFEMLERIPV